VNYRQGIESDLSEVLQTDRVFTNVSKGEFAKSSDLKKAFGSSDEVEVCKLILQKGQIQVSELERSAYLENTLREVAVMISEKCMNPLSHRPYTVETIRNAMKEAEVSLIWFFTTSEINIFKIVFVSCSFLLLLLVSSTCTQPKM
jgi:ribosome maturation protein SDO1